VEAYDNLVAMLAAAALLLAMYPDWVPVRWPSADPKSLELLTNTPVNCLWLERGQWSAEFGAEAAKRGIATLGVIRREGDPIEAVRTLVQTGFTGAVIEGNFDEYSLLIISGTLAKAKMFYLESGPRSRVRFDGDLPIVSTSQGMWPGIHVEKGASATAGPTANPWIDTNTGYLRYARASTDAAVWVAVSPPPKSVYPVQRYMQAIGDAAINGGRWVVSLDDDFWRRLLAREPKALADWGHICSALSHFEEHKEWRSAAPAGQVAVVEDYNDARFSGGLFDMMAAKQVPAYPVPFGRVNAATLHGARVAVEPWPEGVPAAEQPALKAFVESGKAVVTGAPASKKSSSDEEFVFDGTDTRVDQLWQKVSAVLGRQNMGARLFNVASMLSNIVTLQGERQLVLHIVNYSDYPGSGITVRVPGNWHRARLYRPGEAPVDLEVDKVEEGTGFAIDQRVVTIATVVLE
jgi:hypothetical protein